MPENNRKINVNFEKHMLKTCSMKLLDTYLVDFCQKRTVKLSAIVKTKVYNRILTTSAHLELVGNELRTDCM
jgi:hypothetical protein